MRTSVWALAIVNLAIPLTANAQTWTPGIANTGYADFALGPLEGEPVAVTICDPNYGDCNLQNIFLTCSVDGSPLPIGIPAAIPPDNGNVTNISVGYIAEYRSQFSFIVAATNQNDLYEVGFPIYYAPCATDFPYAPIWYRQPTLPAGAGSTVSVAFRNGAYNDPNTLLYWVGTSGTLYYLDGSNWAPTNLNNVVQISYSPSTNEMWALESGGQIYYGNATSWTLASSQPQYCGGIIGEFGGTEGQTPCTQSVGGTLAAFWNPNPSLQTTLNSWNGTGYTLNAAATGPWNTLCENPGNLCTVPPVILQEVQKMLEGGPGYAPGGYTYWELSNTAEVQVFSEN